jgi:hypothetical protein
MQAVQWNGREGVGRQGEGDKVHASGKEKACLVCGAHFTSTYHKESVSEMSPLGLNQGGTCNVR